MDQTNTLLPHTNTVQWEVRYQNLWPRSRSTCIRSTKYRTKGTKGFEKHSNLVPREYDDPDGDPPADA